MVRAIRARSPRIIGIDGDLGSGKTALARALAAALGLPIVHLDDHLAPGRGCFLDALDLEALRTEMASAPLIVEGICLEAALARIGMAPDFRILVRRPPSAPLRKDAIFLETMAYLRDCRPESRCDILLEPDPMTGSFPPLPQPPDTALDIAYIRARTQICITLAVGGMLSFMLGSVLVFLGATVADTQSIKLAGLELNASGLGAIVYGTSSVWAWLAYRARPHFSRRYERSQTDADGTSFSERYSSTQLRAGGGT